MNRTIERQNVVSREYKIMLRASRFHGDENELLEAANAVWRDFSRSVHGTALDTHGGFEDVTSRRLITFFDTVEQHLNASRYIFRERRDIASGEREVTLKFRHADRHVAQDRDMSARTGGRSRTKFEEDIKAPFLSLYSFSTTLRIGDKTLRTLKDVGKLFPDIQHRIDSFEGARALVAVNDLTARELVIGGASVQVGKTPKVNAECGLIVWYDHHGRPDTPVAVEFSYRYANADEWYEGNTARRAFEVFAILQKRLGTWVDAKSPTKTAFVYG